MYYGNYYLNGCKSEAVDILLDDGFLSQAQAHQISAHWKQIRRAGCNQAIEWIERIAAKKAAIADGAAISRI